MVKRNALKFKPRLKLTTIDIFRVNICKVFVHECFFKCSCGMCSLYSFPIWEPVYLPYSCIFSLGFPSIFSIFIFTQLRYAMYNMNFPHPRVKDERTVFMPRACLKLGGIPVVTEPRGTAAAHGSRLYGPGL